MQLQSYERKKGIESDSVAIVGATQAVDNAQGAATGIALPDVKGIEVDAASTYSTAGIDHEAFMREWVEIHMHDPGSEDEPKFAEVTVNGDYCLAVRGETKKMRRYHLAALAQAKQMRLVQSKITNADGSMGYQEKAVLRLVYPFSILHDPSPKGTPWLRQLLGNPA